MWPFDEVALVVGLEAQQHAAQAGLLRLADMDEIGVELLPRHADGGMGIVGEGDVVGAGDFGDAPGGGGAGIVDGEPAGVAAELGVGVVIGGQKGFHGRRHRTPGRGDLSTERPCWLGLAAAWENVIMFG